MKKVYLVKIITSRIWDYEISKLITTQIIVGEENLKAVLEIFPRSEYTELN